MNLEKKILLGFAITVAILIFLGAYSIKNNHESVVINQMVTHTNEVLYNVEHTLVAMLDIVVGQRGYEISGDETFLDPYKSGLSVVHGHLDKTRSLTKDNESQEKKLDTLKRLIAVRIQFAKERIDAKRELILIEKDPKYNAAGNPLIHSAAQDKESILVSHIDAKSVMDQIRSVIRSIQGEEKRLLAVRIKANEKQIDEFNMTFNSLLLSIVILLAMVFILIRVNAKALRQSEEKAKATHILLESSIESQKEVLIFSIDKAYRYLFFNTAYKEGTMHAYGITITTGMNLLDHITNDHDRKKAKANFDRAFAGEGHVTVEEFGEIERYYFETRYSPITNDRNEIIGANAFATNITERMSAEKEISDYKYALDESSIVAITDQKGIIRFANDNFCKISRYSREELLGQDHRIINSGFHPKEFIRGLWQTIAKGEVWKGELRNKAKDGTIYWVDTTIVPFLNNQGKPYQYIAIRSDITDRKERETEIQNLNQELEAFSYSVSHDLRAPLRSINGYSRILLEDYAGKLDQEGRAVLDTVMNNASKMGRLIDDLLDFSRLGRSGLTRTTLEMENLVKEIAAEQLDGTENKVSIDILRLKQSVGDPSMIRQAWTNLVSNAIKYSSKRDHPKIEIGSRSENGNIVY